MSALATVTDFKPDKSKLARIKELSQTHCIGMARMSEVTRERVKTLYNQADKIAIDALRSAKGPEDLRNLSRPGRGRAEELFREVRDALKVALRDLNREAFGLGADILESFIEKASPHVEVLRAREQAVADSFGLRHVDSETVQELASELSRLKVHAQRYRDPELSGWAASPASPLELIGL